MFSDALGFLLKTVFSLFGIALIVRAWIYAIRLHPFNPYSQAVLRVTRWLVQPLQHIVRPGHRIDWPSLLGCWLTAFVLILASQLLYAGQLPAPQVLVPVALAALLFCVKWTLNLIVWVTLIQAVLSWVNPLTPIMAVLHTLTAPLLDPIRRLLPNTGGIDFSPLVLLVLAQVGMIVVSHAAFNYFGL
jgi:YggT family protein